MKPLVGLAGVLLVASAAAGQPGPIAITAQEEVAARNDGAAGLICETRKRHRPPPELEVTITPRRSRSLTTPSEEPDWPRSRFGGATESRSAVNFNLPETQPLSANCLAGNCY
jgi:hypothetical protein